MAPARNENANVAEGARYQPHAGCARARRRMGAQAMTGGAGPALAPMATATTNRRPVMRRHTPSTASGIVAARAVLATLFGDPGERSFAVRYWDGTIEWEGSGEPGFTLV